MPQEVYKNRFQAVLFDMDGTLADTDMVLVLSYLDLFNKYRPDYKPTIKELVYLSGPALIDTMKASFPKTDPNLLVAEFKEVSKKYYERYMVGFPHTQEMLDTIKARGVKVGIVTSKIRSATDEAVHLLGLDGYFDFIVGLDEVKRPKPDPEGLNRGMAYFGVKPENTLFVGDTVYDYEVAKRAGTSVCLVTWNLRELPMDAHADFYIRDYRELVEVVIDGKQERRDLNYR